MRSWSIAVADPVRQTDGSRGIARREGDGFAAVNGATTTIALAQAALAAGRSLAEEGTERGNYLWLAHSKLRHAALGPELLVGELPADIRATSRILRGGETFWERPFLSGEANMSHSIANLEDHHFKYGLFRRPGDVHVRFLGTATLSFGEEVRTEPGDVSEIEAAPVALQVL